jgi:DNA replication protein DnaC
MGMIGYDVPVGDPRFGKLFRCPNFPVEKDLDRQERLRKISNLDAYADKHFTNFQVASPIYSESEGLSLHLAYDGAQNFARRPNGWLLLEGTYGCGKTHLAAAIGNLRLMNGDNVLFITSPDLLDHLRSAYGPDAEMTYDETFDRVRNADLLILDDLGVENPSPWAQEKLFQLLNHRYTYRLPTVITTNADIDRLDPRIRSRLLDVDKTRRVKITAPDYRSLAQNQREQLASTLALYLDKSFDNFDLTTGATPDERQNLANALNVARQYAAHPERTWLLFIGGFGTGKTHLAAAIANERAGRGDEVMFVTVPDLMDYLRTTYGRDADMSFYQRFQKVRNAPLLVLDDFGVENPSAWVREKLFQVLDYRYVARLPTVITTAKEIETLDKRVQTRIFDGQVCYIQAITARSYVMRRQRM